MKRNKLHVVGCSFTNWIFPTWADYVTKHYNIDVVNLGKPGASNDIIKKHLYTIDRTDHVIIMFTGYNRMTIGVDQKHLAKRQKQKKGCPKADGIGVSRHNFFHSDSPLTGFISDQSHETMDFYSDFHMVYNTLENIYDCQNFLQSKKLDYNFCLWQGLDSDVSQGRKLDQDKIKLNDYQANPLYNKVHDSIEKEKFLQPLNTGLWEFLISDKKLVLLQNEFDNHPNSLCHFYYFKNYIKPKLDHKYKPLDNLQHLEDQATRFSEYYAGLSWYKFNVLCNDEPFDVRPGRFKENKQTFFNIFGW